jgi:hypothetical protein
MLTKRIIPCLDIKDGRTVKGVNFAELRDAGDPIELAALYALQGADELVFLDITATVEKRKTLSELVNKIAHKINIPFTVGGGIKTEEDVSILLQNGVRCSSFCEPDLGDQMTAICFIIDEKVFNREVYLDFGDWVMENHFGYLKNNMLTGGKIERMRKEGYFLNGNVTEKKLYSDWVDFVGGEKNVFLRDFLKNAKLA